MLCELLWGKICEDHVNLQGWILQSIRREIVFFFGKNLWRIKMVLHNVVLYITITKLLLKQIIRFAFCQVRTIQGHFAAELEWFVNTGEQRVNEEIYDYDKDKWLKKFV